MRHEKCAAAQPGAIRTHEVRCWLGTVLVGNGDAGVRVRCVSPLGQAGPRGRGSDADARSALRGFRDM